MTDSENPAGLFRSCLKKAGSGDIESILIAAACYIEGCGVSKNEKKGFDLFKKAAERGNAAAQYEIGLQNYYGFSGKRNLKKALFWFKMSELNGNLLSSVYLYRIYESGEGVAADPKQAFESLVRVGKNPETFTKQFMAYRYIPWKPENKTGPEKAEESLAAIRFTIGLFYDSGYGIRKNRKTARSWFEKAAEYGLPEAVQMLAEINEREEKEAAEKEEKKQQKLREENRKAQEENTATVRFSSDPGRGRGSGSFGYMPEAADTGDKIVADGLKHFDEEIKSLQKKHTIPGDSDIITICAELEGFEDIIRREIEIEKYFTLEQLAFSVIAAFKGDCSHLFNIQFNGKRYELSPDDDFFPGEDDLPAAEDFFLEDLDIKEGSEMTLEYDYGVCWTWNITVTGIRENNDRRFSYPRVINGAGAGIIENISPFVFEEMIEFSKKTGKPAKYDNGERMVSWDFRKFNKKTSTRDMAKFLDEIYGYEDEDRKQKTEETNKNKKDQIIRFE